MHRRPLGALNCRAPPVLLPPKALRSSAASGADADKMQGTPGVDEASPLTERKDGDATVMIQSAWRFFRQRPGVVQPGRHCAGTLAFGCDCGHWPVSAGGFRRFCRDCPARVDRGLRAVEAPGSCLIGEDKKALARRERVEIREEIDYVTNIRNSNGSICQIRCESKKSAMSASTTIDCRRSANSGRFMGFAVSRVCCKTSRAGPRTE
jgi:hypothetical protein